MSKYELTHTSGLAAKHSFYCIYFIEISTHFACETFFEIQDTDVRMSHMSGRWDTFEVNGTKQRLDLKPG